eukprot:scaffold1504_cov417-Prasinococcus_capsulatus_cf.AAC.70
MSCVAAPAPGVGSKMGAPGGWFQRWAPADRVLHLGPCPEARLLVATAGSPADQAPPQPPFQPTPPLKPRRLRGPGWGTICGLPRRVSGPGHQG